MSQEHHPKSKKNHVGLIITVSILADIFILLLFFSPLVGYSGKVSFDLYLFPRFNAVFNSFTFIFLCFALWAIIKKKNIKLHRGFILAAWVTTMLFLFSYLTFHFLQSEPPKFGGQGVVRPIYFFILVSHSILAALVVPLALFSTWWGWSMQTVKHKKIVRWTMPIWLYVSITGVIVYLFMAPHY